MNTSAIYQRHYDDEPDWQQSENVIFEKSCDSIRRFALEHPECVCSFFAYMATSVYIDICLDSAQNGLSEAQKYQESWIGSRAKDLVTEDAWKIEQEYLARSMFTHSGSVGDFEFNPFERVHFLDWETFRRSPCYPECQKDNDPDYLTGHVSLILWRVLERLHEAKIFQQLNLASPFRLGYEDYDDVRGLVVVRIMNWP